MKENKKGFTLIELLAVLVVLAILALIAVPIVLNIIESSRQKARLRSVEGFAKAVESAVYIYQMDNQNVPSTSITLAESSSNDGSFSLYVNGSGVRTIDYSGNEVHGCTLSLSGDVVSLTNCTVGTNEDTIHYSNGRADYDD